MDMKSELSGTANATTLATGKVDWRGTLWFIVLTFVITWGFWIPTYYLKVPFALRAAVGMFIPALVCLLVRLLRHEGFADAGLRLAGKGIRGAWKYYIAAYFLPIILIAIGGILALLTGVQPYNLPSFVQHALKGSYTLLSVVIIETLTLSIAITMVATFGEEFGWRGYLLPRLMPLGGVWAALLVGVIWGLWHAPIIFLDGYEYNDPHSIGAVCMFLLFTIPVSFIFTWLRNRTQSIWPTVLAHAVINSAGPLMLYFLVFKNTYLGAVIGLLGVLPLIICAVWLALTGKLAAQH